jgi:hypothetical protein
MNKSILTYLIAALLCGAAAFKIFYPSPALKTFHLLVSLLELLLAGILLLFSHRWQVWALLTMVFATWGGYAFYTTIFGLPCSCLGSAFILPRGTSLGLNFLLLGISWGWLRKLPDSASFPFYWLGIFSGVLFAAGFLSAHFIIEY